MGPKSMIKNNTDKVKKSTVQFLEKPTSKILDKSSKLSHSKTEDLKNNKLHGGISVKDDPDKIDKEAYESEEEEDKDDDDEKEEEEEEEEEVEEVEKEEFDKEKDEDEEGVEGEGDECVYRLTKKKNTIDVEIEEGEDMFEDDDINQIDNKSKYVKNSDRKTKPFLFDFERVRLLGERARQLSLGAKPMIKNIEDMDPKVVAKLELEKKIIPLIILRELPNGLIEKWKVSELSY
jgi:DNA-directed RNA polymerase subunit K/omega